MTYRDLNINERINVKSHLFGFLFPMQQAQRVTEWFLRNKSIQPDRSIERNGCRWFHEQYNSGRTMSDYK